MLELWLVFLPLLPGFYGLKFKAFFIPFFSGQVFIADLWTERDSEGREMVHYQTRGNNLLREKNTITELALPEKKRGTF